MPDTDPRELCQCGHIQASHYGQHMNRLPGHCTGNGSKECQCEQFQGEEKDLLSKINDELRKQSAPDEIIDENKISQNLLLQYREKNSLLELHNARLDNLVQEQAQEIRELREKCNKVNAFVTGIAPNPELNDETAKAQARAWTYKYVSEMSYEEIQSFVTRCTEVIGIAKALQSKKTATIKIREKDLKQVKVAEETRTKEKPKAGKPATSPYDKMLAKLMSGAMSIYPKAKAEVESRKICDALVSQGKLKGN